MKKNFFKIMVTILAVIMSMCIFVACEETDPQKEYRTVTFDFNGGVMEGEDATLSILDGTELNLSTYVPTKENYTLDGWKVGETSYAKDGQVEITADTIIIAQWKIVEHQVTLNLDGGELTGETTFAIAHGQSVNLANYTPTKTNYTLDGWKVGETSYAKDGQVEITADTIIIAQWKIVAKITTSLVDKNVYKSAKLTFDVFAKDANDNKIASSVTLNGNSVAINWDDTEKTSFTLNFSQYENIVVISASVNGQTTNLTYTIYFKEEPITFTFAVEAFTIGCGYVIDPIQIVVDDALIKEMNELFEYDCTLEEFKEQHLNSAHVLLYTLAKYGYEGDYTGTPDSGFYLAIIKGFQNSNNIPGDLMDKLEKNGITTDEKPSAEDELGEFDYTYMSGWMYCVNGVFPNVGFADYYIQDGDVIRVVFTLAYGADLGPSFFGDPWFKDVQAERDILTTTLAKAIAQGKNKTDEYKAAFEVIQKFDVTAEELTKVTTALAKILD